MKRNVILLISALMLASASNAYAASWGNTKPGSWRLIHYEFIENTWYCTYQMQGSSEQKTITSDEFCKSTYSD